MKVTSDVKVNIPGKGEYENCLENGVECEFLNGVWLLDGHYCKYYGRARDWSDKSVLDKNRRPVLKHFCTKSKVFMGCSYCCGPSCFEKGKSAGVKRVLNQIRKRRLTLED